MALFALVPLAAGAYAEGTVNISLLTPFSGPFADFGEQMRNGAALYLRQHGDVAAGKKIVILRRNTTGANPAVAKRLAQGLVIRDHVAFLTGFGLTPNAPAVAPIVDDSVIRSLRDKILGVISVQDYSYAHPSARNRAYVKAYEAAFGRRERPNFMSVAAYDGMAAMWKVIDKLHRAVTGDKAMAAFKGMKLDSPQGPIEVDPARRELIESVYIRRVAWVHGAIVNREIKTFPRINSLDK